jgi:hypothetical protein
MAKRLVDGEALWGSNKLRNVPAQYRAEYANLIPLAEADGTFEADTRKVWARVYAYNREEVTIDMVESILDAFEEAGMISRATDEAGKLWGRILGIELRLPPESHRDRYKQGNSNVFTDIDEKVRPDGENPSRLGIGLDKDRLGLVGDVATSGQDSFKAAKKIFRRYVGVSFGSLGNRTGQWNDLARKYGSEVLVEAVEMYSRELGKAGRGLNYPLAHFLKNCEEYIEHIVEKKQSAEVKAVEYRIKDVPDPFEIAPDPDALSPEDILANREKI